MTIFTHQTILLSISYLKYETVIDLKLIGKQHNLDSNPAISLCLKSSRFYSDQNVSSLILDRIGKIKCEIVNGRKNLEYSTKKNNFFFN
jgi:hypothetical protein